MALSRQSKTDKLIDKRIEQAYYRTSSGVQINIMDIPKIYREARATMQPDTTDAALEQIITSIVARYRLN